MLHNPTWQATDDLTRAQLAMFHMLGDRIALTQDERRRALALDDHAWAVWTDYLADGPLPAEPPVPEMLRRLGQTSFILAMAGELRVQHSQSRL